MISAETLKGNKPSWVQKDWNEEGSTTVGYSTNFGVLELNQDTNAVEFACIGLGRNQYNTRMQIKIVDGEFQVLKTSAGRKYSLYSKKFPYKEEESHELELGEVIKMLQMDDNMSVAAVKVKIELIRLIQGSMKLSRSEQKELKELMSSCRNPITSTKTKSVKRTPIVTRKPIL